MSDFLSRLLSFYASAKKLGNVGVEKVMISLTRNDYEPDLVFFDKEKVDSFSDDQVLFPAPNFVVEILSKKTTHIDRGVKLMDYAAHGVTEYWIIDPVKETIEQYLLLGPEDSEYSPAKKFQRGAIIESKAVPGFNIPVEALFSEEANITALQQLLR